MMKWHRLRIRRCSASALRWSRIRGANWVVMPEVSTPWPICRLRSLGQLTSRSVGWCVLGRENPDRNRGRRGWDAMAAHLILAGRKAVSVPRERHHGLFAGSHLTRRPDSDAEWAGRDGSPARVFHDEGDTSGGKPHDDRVGGGVTNTDLDLDRLTGMEFHRRHVHPRDQ